MRLIKYLLIVFMFSCGDDKTNYNNTEIFKIEAEVNYLAEVEPKKSYLFRLVVKIFVQEDDLNKIFNTDNYLYYKVESKEELNKIHFKKGLFTKCSNDACMIAVFEGEIENHFEFIEVAGVKTFLNK